MFSGHVLTRDMVSKSIYQRFSTVASSRHWKGSKPKDHITRTDDSHNTQIDAAKEGAADRASSNGSTAATEKDKGDNNSKSKETHPKAPDPVIGMNDERGGVSTVSIWVGSKTADLSREVDDNEKACRLFVKLAREEFLYCILLWNICTVLSFLSDSALSCHR